MPKALDLTGQRFGRLVVIKEVDPIVKYYPGRKRSYKKYLCRCDCGKEKIVTASHLRNANTKSCGCLNKELQELRFNDLTGMKFGRLTVIKRSENKYSPSGQQKTQWECKCDCGNITTVFASNLISGSTLSCGCYGNEERKKSATTHGCSNERLYIVWTSILKRCFNKNCKAYKNYGGRGISICEEWHDYTKFREWAYANGYDENAKYGDCTIDRIDVNGNYEPTNCRWVDMKTQSRNKRNSRKENK